ncbi:MAG: FKBP-type peptidyl-prolyl cis-trans isomerase [Chlamydiales bacterium]
MNKVLCLLMLLAFPLMGDDSSDEINYDKLSEAFGHLVVRHAMNPGLDLNLDKVIKGIQDERAGKPSPLTEEEYEQTIYAIQEKLYLQTAEKNLKEATAFLESNSKKEGIQAIDAQLQYKVIQAGEGTEVSQESAPLIHYKGSLIDGTLFASSEENGEPISLPLTQTIPGIAQGVAGMKEGEKRVIYIHPELAYGMSGQLPPNSLLIFEVEVIKAGMEAEEEIAQNE